MLFILAVVFNMIFELREYYNAAYYGIEKSYKIDRIQGSRSGRVFRIEHEPTCTISYSKDYNVGDVVTLYTCAECNICPVANKSTAINKFYFMIFLNAVFLYLTIYIIKSFLKKMNHLKNIERENY